MALPRPDSLLAVAQVTRPHGVHGELSALPLAPSVLDPAALIVRMLYTRDAHGRVGRVRGLALRPHQDRWLIRLEGIDSPEQVDALRGVDLCLTRAEMPPLPEGWHWEEDLQACRAVDRQLGDLGAVAGLEELGGRMQLAVLRPGGRKAFVPWVPALVARVDLAQGVVHLDLPPDYPGISDEEPG